MSHASTVSIRRPSPLRSDSAITHASPSSHSHSHNSRGHTHSNRSPRDCRHSYQSLGRHARSARSHSHSVFLSRRRSRKGPNAAILKAAWCLFVDIHCGRVEPSVAMARAKHLYTQSPHAAAQLRAWLIARPPARETILGKKK